MYLSKLVLNPRSRMVRRDLADCQSLHQTILSAFPAKSDGGGARQEFGLLHRLEPSRQGVAPVLLVQSLLAPDWKQLPVDYLAQLLRSTNPAVVPLSPFLGSLRQGERLRFRLRANPTRKVDTKSGPKGERRNGRRVKLKTEAEQVAWLQRKAAQGSFELLAVRTSADIPAVDVVDEGQATGWRRKADGHGVHLTFGTVLYDGYLRIIDPERFRQTVEAGLGSGKAYGFGLLSVGRLDCVRDS